MSTSSSHFWCIQIIGTSVPAGQARVGQIRQPNESDRQGIRLFTGSARALQLVKNISTESDHGGRRGSGTHWLCSENPRWPGAARHAGPTLVPLLPAPCQDSENGRERGGCIWGREPHHRISRTVTPRTSSGPRGHCGMLTKGQLHGEATDKEGIVSSRVVGPCPRCGHGLDDPQTHSAVTNMLGGEWRGLSPTGQEKAPAYLTVDVSCGCHEPRSGTPAGRTGCGVTFRVKLRSVRCTDERDARDG